MVDHYGLDPRGDRRAWKIQAFGEDRQYAGNLGYSEDPRKVYRYDSNVANYTRVAEGDIALIETRDGLLGLAVIDRIDSHHGTKELQRCPICETTALKTRRTKTPLYRCSKGHEFDHPETELN